jgi:ubiquinone/menaquinone biosynthesis C-methylase UbiE
MSSLPKDTREIKEEYNKWHSKVISEYYDRKFYQWLKKQANLLPNEIVLDVGCGKGDWLNFLELTNLYRVGVDISSVALRYARRKGISANIDYVLADAENLPFRESSFDKVFCLGSLEHFANPQKGVLEIKRVLKHKGISYIFLPNAYFLGHIYLVYKTGEPPDEGGQYFSETFATRKGWEKLLASSGLRIVNVLKYNRISRASRKVSSPIRVLYNLLIAPFVPLNLSYAFLFICIKEN